MDSLKRVPYFQYFLDETLIRMTDVMETHYVEKNERLFAVGEEDSRVYIVVRGELTVFIHLDMAVPRLLDVLY